jgi:predicted nucleotidyltransferase
MKIPQDFKEFIELLNKHRVEYLIVGGYALGYHSRPKFTQDIDFWIGRNQSNAQKVLTVLEEFGFGELDITIRDLISENKIIQLGNAPLRIDIITDVTGLDFKAAFKKRVSALYLGVTASFISLSDLITNKKSSSRQKDLEDLNWIERYVEKE